MGGFQTTVGSATVFGSISRIIREETETVDRGWCSKNQYGSFCRSVACPYYTGGLVTSKCNTLNCGNFMSRQHAHESVPCTSCTKCTNRIRFCRFVTWPQLLQDLRTKNYNKICHEKSNVSAHRSNVTAT
jgi:hypothetical protein